MSDLLSGLAGWATDVVESFGYVGVAMLITLENVFPPLPSELILPLAGFLAGQGRLSFVGAVSAATAGSLAGALILYAAAAWLGEARLRAIVERMPLVETADVDRANEWFARHGSSAVLIGRMVPVVRSLISLPAGLNRMPIRRFVAYTAIGSGAWNVLLIGLGWILGDRWELIRQWTQTLEWLVLGVLAGLVIWVVWRRLRTSQP
ncbi:MAG TPA: DedA family protein [Candidatus Limnocylindria bacterium]